MELETINKLAATPPPRPLRPFNLRSAESMRNFITAARAELGLPESEISHGSLYLVARDLENKLKARSAPATATAPAATVQHFSTYTPMSNTFPTTAPAQPQTTNPQAAPVISEDKLLAICVAVFGEQKTAETLRDVAHQYGQDKTLARRDALLKNFVMAGLVVPGVDHSSLVTGSRQTSAARRAAAANWQLVINRMVGVK